MQVVTADKVSHGMQTLLLANVSQMLETFIYQQYRDAITATS